MSRRPTPCPPTPDDPEGDTGHRPSLSAVRRNYRVRTNGYVWVVERRVFWFFWEPQIDAPSADWAERWIREQMRRAAERSGPWRKVNVGGYPPMPCPLPPPPPTPPAAQKDAS